MANSARGVFRNSVLAALMLLAACSESFRNHGYVPSEEDLQQITVGVDTRDSVRTTLGAPSSGGLMEGGDYYYVRSRVRHYAWQEPEVIDRQVVAVSFSSSGTVANVERFDLSNGQVVPLSRRVTTTTVSNKSFIRQLLAGIGRINASSFLQ